VFILLLEDGVQAIKNALVASNSPKAKILFIELSLLKEFGLDIRE
jgi:hypothetical protein